MPFAPYNDYSIEYSVEGNGKGLVLIHGTGQSAENTWPEVVKHFAACNPGRRVVCPNYSGSGKTTDSGQELTIAFLAEQVLAAADHAEVERFDVVGHSLGTCVAVYLAAHYPNRVGKMALLAGFISTEDARSQLQFRMWKEMADTNPRLLAEMFLFTAFSPRFVAQMNDCTAKSVVEDIYRTTNWQGASRQISLDLSVNMAQEVRMIQQKTLVIGCQHDFIVPLSHSEALRGHLPHAEYRELDAGHGGATENPVEFINLLDAFLKQ